MTMRRARHAAVPARRSLLAGAATVSLAALISGMLWVPAQASGAAGTSLFWPDPPTPAAPTAPPSASPSSTPDLLSGLGTVPADPAGRTAYIAELRRRIAAAQAAHVTAASALEAAASAATTAARVAAAAEQRSSLARDQLTLWTSYLYRVSGNTGLIVAMFNDPTADPQEFLRGTADADTLSEGFIRDLTEAHEAAVAARTASAEATTLQAKAQVQAEAAESARLALLGLLKPAEAASAAAAAVTAARQAEAAAAVAGAGATGPQVVIDGRACPATVPAGTLRGGSADLGAAALCQQAVAQAATPQAALAIQAAFQMLGAPYACQGIGRQDPFRFDCSSLVSRAYFLGAGIDTAGTTWAPSTRDMVPWDGVPLAWWASFVDQRNIRPGDLVLYDTGGAAYRHVAMYLGNGYMLHTNACGDVAHVTSFWGFGTGGHRSFLVVRRVVAPGDYRVPDPKPIPTGGAPVTAKPDPGAGDPKVTVPVPPKPTTPPTTASPSPTPVSPPSSPSASTTSPRPSTTPPDPSPSGTPSATPSTSPSTVNSTGPSNPAPSPSASPGETQTSPAPAASPTS